MSLRRLFALLGLALALTFTFARAATSDFSRDWRFHLGDIPGARTPPSASASTSSSATAVDDPAAPAFDDHTWPLVNAPHAARLEALVTDTGAHQQWEGICWYRKTFTLPRAAAGQIVHLRFEGAMNVAEVFVNGQHRTTNLDGYTPFVVDLSDLARSAPTAPITVALRLDNHATPVTGPKPLAQLDFHLYHGLYRPVSLTIQSPLHITDEILENIPASGGVLVTFPEISDAAATVVTRISVRNADKHAAHFIVGTMLLDHDGDPVARRDSGELTLAPGATQDFSTQMVVQNPRLWSPATPNLYLLDVSVAKSMPNRAHVIVDNRQLHIGLRRATFTGSTFLLNAHPLFLRGVNRHQEHPYVGNALPANAQFRDAYRIKAAGFDYIRLSHYPHDPAFMDACDALGLITVDSILGWQFNPGTPEFAANRLASARALVRRDRNHPSALFWELSLNETAMSPDFIAVLHAAGHEEFPGDQMFTAGWVDGFDIKLTARQHGSTKEFAAIARPAIISEYGDWEYYAQNAGLAQDAWANLQPAARSSRQLRGDGELRLLQQATNLQEAHNDNRSTRAFADGYWDMFDYNRGYAPDLESSGVMDIFRLPKFSFYFFQSQRDATEKLPHGLGGPMVFIANYWTPTSPTTVRVFSNADEVELLLNGQRIARQSPDRDRLSTHLAHPPFTFHVPAFAPGGLRAIAYLAGKPVAEHMVRTPGAPHHLTLDLDESGRPLARDGDLVFVHARIVDAAGTTIPDASLPVTFTLEGDAELLGDNPIPAEAGIASILLKTGPAAHALRLHATAENLTGDLIVPLP